MALRARLSAPREERTDWPWHHLKWTELSSSLLIGGDRRMEAASYLAGGYGLRLALEARKTGWTRLIELAKVWQPSRLKGIQVSQEYGTPFLAATQVFDLRPIPRKFLSLDRTDSATERFVSSGIILVTCSGCVGRATLAHKPHDNILISHDLLRIEPKHPEWWGWLYAYLRSPQARLMMSAAQYGHVIKHLEICHLNALPIPILREGLLDAFNAKVSLILSKRDQAFQLFLEAETYFEREIGPLDITDFGEEGFSVKASSLSSGRRRFEGFFHNPAVRTIQNHFLRKGKNTVRLVDAGYDVWLPNRFKRITATDGVELLDSSDLFEINPDIGRRIADIDFGDKFQGRVKAGWLLVARSGQIYGLNGSIAIANAFHEGKVVSDDVIRVAPCTEASIRPGYLFVALSHPMLGRPLVKARIYGSSIPHLDVTDISTLEVVRISTIAENDIADLAERASALQAEADILEHEIAGDAEVLINRFIEGDMSDVVVVGKP